MKQLFSELCIIAAGAVFFFALAATFGIPRSQRSTPTAVAADEVVPKSGANYSYGFGRSEIPELMERGWAP